MYHSEGALVVSATDLVGHLACEHLTVLDRQTIGGGMPRPLRGDPELEVLRKRGLEHEAQYLGWLGDEGLDVMEIAEPGHDGDVLAALRQREAETLEAMQRGVDVVFQATFLDERGQVAWRGHADFLRKVPAETDLGRHGYEPEDTKLARHVKPSALLQLCHYAEQVERLQGTRPDQVHVVLGGQERASFGLSDFDAYYRAARDQFLAALRAQRATYPLPVPHCAVCAWLTTCEKRREEDDHLCRVATLSREQARKLDASGVPTLTALAHTGDDLTVRGIGLSTLGRLRHQARLQAARGEGEPPPVERLLPIEPGRGLAALPPPDPGDIFYDIEGDPYVGAAGLEYLHGVGWVEGGELVFRPFWAHDERGERRAFEELIDLLVERRRKFPKMHVYHYAPYEPSALGRLMGRHGTREDELDGLLRGNVFVDLYRVVRQGLVVGSPSYSLKKLEPLYMPARRGEITDAASSIVEYERWLQTQEQSILDDLEAYNRDDVESTWRLRGWLEAQRQAAIADGHDLPRPWAAPDEEVETQRDSSPDLVALRNRLLDGVTEPPGANDSDEARTRWLLAQLLEWHRREDKPEWWQFFERVLRYDDQDLLWDTEAVAGLERAGEPTPDKRSLIWPYRFDPDQEHKLAAGSAVCDPATERLKLETGAGPPDPGTLVACDPIAGTLALRRGNKSRAPHPSALIPGGPIRTEEQRASLLRVARALLDHGIDGPGPAAAARQLLARRQPRLPGRSPGQPLRRPGEGTLDAAKRLVLDLDRSYLPVQGPPGAGKTYTAARAIVALVADGRRVGITANSHAVISHLLGCVLEAAEEVGQPVRAIQKVSDDGTRVGHPAVRPTKSNRDVETALAYGMVDVVAGTSWLFARDAMTEALHTLVVDEAGQLSLANVIAVAPAAANLVLVGDPRQLAQPSKGAQPEGAGVSGLEHVFGGEATVPDHMGLFLDRTWRLHPEICGFISEQVYAGRLASQDHCERRRIDYGTTVGGVGLRWVAVDHEGNRTSSPEEAAAVARVFGALLGRGWTEGDGERATLGIEHILVVAPYNAQVRLLAEHLPDGARVGTVDKFQGQEAPVVIVSLAASSAEDVPRGMEFLYSVNRLNVAVSRAQALSVLVASPRLLAVRCRTVEQMRLANVLCRYVELAERIDLMALDTSPAAKRP